LAKKSRREIADLLQKSRVETARLRVEGLIQDDIYVELLELLEVGLTDLPTLIITMRGTYEHRSSHEFAMYQLMMQLYSEMLQARFNLLDAST
jgi:hypothetical protein